MSDRGVGKGLVAGGGILAVVGSLFAHGASDCARVGAKGASLAGPAARAGSEVAVGVQAARVGAEAAVGAKAARGAGEVAVGARGASALESGAHALPAGPAPAQARAPSPG